MEITLFGNNKVETGSVVASQLTAAHPDGGFLLAWVRGMAHKDSFFYSLFIFF